MEIILFSGFRASLEVNLRDCNWSHFLPRNYSEQGNEGLPPGTVG